MNTLDFHILNLLEGDAMLNVTIAQKTGYSEYATRKHLQHLIAWVLLKWETLLVVRPTRWQIKALRRFRE